MCTWCCRLDFTLCYLLRVRWPSIIVVQHESGSLVAAWQQVKDFSIACVSISVTVPDDDAFIEVKHIRHDALADGLQTH